MDLVTLIRPVIAQVRESGEVLLSPALEVFSGTGTKEENFYIALIVIFGGLIFATLWFWFTVGLQQFSWKMFQKVFGMWLIFALGVASLSTTRYLVQERQRLGIQADFQAQPTDVRAEIQDHRVILKWSTAKPTIGLAIFYPNNGGIPLVMVSNDRAKTTTHTVEAVFSPDVNSVEAVIMSDGVEYKDQEKNLKIILTK